MSEDYWLKQTASKILYADLFWSRPENKFSAGKLLIIGGNIHGFSAVGNAFETANKAGVGEARILLPDSLQKTLSRVLNNVDYLPSTPSGSFAQSSLAEFLTHSAWADAVILAGDFGRNSETAILLEKFVSKYVGELIITADALDYFTKSPSTILNKNDCLIVASFAQLQKIASSSRQIKPFTFNMNLSQLVDQLHYYTMSYPIKIVVKHLDNIVVACEGQISTTKLQEDILTWRVKTAAYASVWWLQNPQKSFEAITSSIVDYLGYKIN